MQKKTTKKAPAKKAVTKKTTAKSAAKPVQVKMVKDKLTKSQLFNVISEQTCLPRKDVVNVFVALENTIEASVKKGAVGEFTLPGLAKIVTIRKKATKERKGISPFTGEPTVFKAKPARTVVKVRPLKKLKDLVA